LCEKILEGPIRKSVKSSYFLLVTGDLLIAATEKTVVIWDEVSGKLKHVIHYDEPIIAADAEETKLACVSKTTLKVFDLLSGDCLFVHTQMESPLTSVKLDGPLVIIGAIIGPAVQVFNMHLGERIIGLIHSGANSLLFVEQNLISVGTHTVSLWNHHLYTSPVKKHKLN